jgi:uncharacterized membrane protein
MKKGRLEAFSDGVIAIIITIMVLELKIPQGSSLDSLKPVLPVFLTYILSFINIAIYWNNHHHMMHTAESVNGTVLWANIHLLFWLSLIPFATGWMGENHYAKWPVALYGIILLMAGLAYTFLAISLIRLHGRESTLSKALGSDLKGKVSLLIYATGICLTFIDPAFGLALYALVAGIWFIPDKRIEKNIH